MKFMKLKYLENCWSEFDETDTDAGTDIKLNGPNTILENKSRASLPTRSEIQSCPILMAIDM